VLRLFWQLQLRQWQMHSLAAVAALSWMWPVLFFGTMVGAAASRQNAQPLLMVMVLHD
jgi:hypothetical protein